MIGAVDNGAENCEHKHESKRDPGQGVNFLDRMFAHQDVRGHGDDKAESDHGNNG